MRLAGLCCAVLVSNIATLGAQRPEPAVSPESVRLALQRAQGPGLFLPPLSSVPPRITRLGILTLATPDTNGEIVKMVVPVGELTMRLARTVSNAQHRRAERKAREAVERDLQDFHDRRPAR